MHLLHWLRGFAVDQRCIPQTARAWRGRWCPRLRTFLRTARLNANRLRLLLAESVADPTVETIHEDGFESEFLLAHGTVRKLAPRPKETPR